MVVHHTAEFVPYYRGRGPAMAVEAAQPATMLQAEKIPDASSGWWAKARPDGKRLLTHDGREVPWKPGDLIDLYHARRTGASAWCGTYRVLAEAEPAVPWHLTGVG